MKSQGRLGSNPPGQAAGGVLGTVGAGCGSVCVTSFSGGAETEELPDGLGVSSLTGEDSLFVTVVLFDVSLFEADAASFFCDTILKSRQYK